MTLIPNLKTISSLLMEYQKIRQQSLDICAPLSLEDYVVQPIIDVSPPKWHLGHTTWFFENFILVPRVKGYQAFDERLNYFFNSYYESQGPRILRSMRGNMTRPSLEKIVEYRHYVDQHLENWLRGDVRLVEDDKLRDLLILGLQHEQQHQELLVTDIKYILGNNPLFPAYQEATETPVKNQVRPANFLSFSEGIYEIGYQGNGFCFDNELGVHKVFLHDFQLQDRVVTNGEYLEFMQAGGYEQFEHWLSEGWEWVKQLETKAPLYWYKRGDEWWQYSLNGLAKVDPNLPVTHISYYEADAFAQWSEMRLPTEFEWEVACNQLYDAVPEVGNFLDSGQFHPTATTSGQDYQMLGQVWEWTASAYLPYPNYPRLKGALGEYNGKFMVNQMVLRGGSCATPASHIRPSYRNFFQTDKRWQFTGIRLAK
ncbi:MAG: ergothioneine biosynthesis protein EgtB [Saprospiraceae bacterium]|nr:MAG: ergothioneine biosynthesis protein EgtB [Saprospiraceae bacterium]